MSNDFGGNGLYLAHFFQVAYVTRDLEHAVRTFQRRYGIGSFQYLRGNRFDESTTIDIAMAWVGQVMVELIQPTGAGRSIYEIVLDGGEKAIRLHHLGHLIADEDEWDRLLEEVRRGEHPVAMEGRIEGFLRYLYVDARAETGHYLEYILCEPAGRAFFDSVPRS